MIGDVHGRATELRALLERIGYRETVPGYRHPTRTAVFLGDLVDRGPDVAGALALVKAMVDSGAAEMVLGNHELNLLDWFAEDGRGGYLREHSAKNWKQVQHSLPLFERDQVLGEEYLAWFRSRPLFLAHGGACFVHASWRPVDLALLGSRNTLEAAGWGRPSFRHSRAGQAVVHLLKGPEAKLPEGLGYKDGDGRRRRRARLRWWLEPSSVDFQSAVLADIPSLGGLPVPGELAGAFAPPGAGAGPVFIGHYQFPACPGALHPRVACVDYEGNGGIGAYRWDGEETICRGHFL